MDISDFTTKDGSKPSRPAERENVDRRWWSLSKEDATNSISAVLKQMEETQKQRLAQYVVSSRLYGNLSLMGLNGTAWGRMAAQHPNLRDRVSYNVSQSVIDTLQAKIGKNKPKPMFLTSSGQFSDQRKAKKLNEFVEGLFYETRAHEIGVDAWRDCAVWGDGFVHPYRDRNNRVALERVLPVELWVDDLDGLYRQPRQLHRCKNVDRHVLLEAFGRDIIKTAARSRPEEGSSYENVADVITVRESWHLPSGPDAHDGRHAITIQEGNLLWEPWTRDEFPFARITWSPRLYGYWGQGLAEQLQNIQIEINKLLWTVQRSFHLGGTHKILMKIGSKIVPEHLTNDLGVVIKYAGDSRPEWATPPLVQPEIFAHLERLIKAAYEQAGLTMMSAAGQKPAGIDSGKALRTLEDIESTRFVITAQRYDQFYLDVARIAIDVVKDIAEDIGDYETRVPGGRVANLLRWQDVDLDEDATVMQCFPTSSLPTDPAGRYQQIQEWVQAGWYTPRQGKRLMDFPDLQAVDTLDSAQEEWIDKCIESIIDGAEDEPMPVLEPFDDVDLAHQLALQTYAQGKTGNLEEWRLEKLRRFIAQAVQIKAAAQAAIQAQAAAMAQAQNPQPQANPEATPTTPLVQNTPGASA
jgi:hypothetical protein